MIRSTFSDVRCSLVLDHVDVGVQPAQGLGRRLGLRHADAVGGVHHLPLQVRVVDDVGVDDAERADAGRGQVQRRGGAETAGAEQQHLRGQQLELAGLADLGDQDVPGVAAPLRLVEQRSAPPSGSRSASSPRSRRAGTRRPRSRARSGPSRRTPSGRRTDRSGRSGSSGRGRGSRCATRGSRAGCAGTTGSRPARTRPARGRRSAPGRRRSRARRTARARRSRGSLASSVPGAPGRSPRSSFQAAAGAAITRYACLRSSQRAGR